LLSQATEPDASPNRQYATNPAVPKIEPLYADERGEQTGGAAATTPVAAELAELEPAAFEPVTATRTVEPTSAGPNK
jgi:hypothetical protein